jgi:hypothetical protein
LEGVCKAPARPQGKVDGCKTVITKGDLDRFTKSFAPETGDSARGRVAMQFAKTVALSQLAQQMGLDKDSALSKEIDYQLSVIRMRILATAYMQLQQQKIQIAEADIQKFYDDHRDQYEEVQVRRLAVPFLVPTVDGHPLDHAAVLAEMTEIQKRAVAGEDMDQLQQEAFKALHIQAPAPPVVVRAVRRGTLQGEEAKVFDMKPGEISPVLEAPAAFAIVKIESNDLTPLGAARREIEAVLRRDAVQNELSEAAKKIHAQFNLSYLDLTAQPNLFSVTASAAPITDASAVSKVTKPQP